MQQKFTLNNILAIGVLFLMLISVPARAQDSDSTEFTIFDLSLEQLLGIEMKESPFKLYGYINSNVEKVFNEPSVGSDGNTETESAPLEWSPVKAFHLYGTGDLSDNISVLFNIASPGGEGFEVRNAWGNLRIKPELQVRVGKMYRRFGLYNEKLDQIPTFIGIEPPELFDTDHLFVTRTTTLMVHGEKDLPFGNLSYALTSGNSEGGPQLDIMPLGWDVRLKRSDLIVGTSGFTSSVNGEKTGSTVSFGSGSPNGGILPWMDGGHFVLFGGFLEKRLGNFVVQTEFWNAAHDGIRNAENVLTIIQEAGINDRQRENFLGENSSLANADLTVDDVITETSFNAQTFYVRVGYDLRTNVGQFVPYLFFDWMSNPEVIQNKTYGGDNEAGLADDGQFMKPSVGVVYRPIQTIAIKLDASVHAQEFNGETTMYPEVRMDFSFAFNALSVLDN